MKILVFDIGGTSIKYGTCIDHTLKDVRELPTNAHLGGSHILDTLKTLIRREQGYDAIGISTAGQVNSATGTILYANSNIPGYTGIELRRELMEQFHVPVLVENDVNAAAMGEAVYGAGKDQEDFLCLTYGTGVGGAIIQRRCIYHGSSFSAAEFGAIVTHGEARETSGDFWDGCYERYASTTALVKMVSGYDPSLTDGRAIFARLSDPKVRHILDRWIHELLLGLSSLIHIFNPSCVILGGGIMVQPWILEKIREKLPLYVMPGFAHVQVRAAGLGNTAGLLGANYLTIQSMKDVLK